MGDIVRDLETSRPHRKLYLIIKPELTPTRLNFVCEEYVVVDGVLNRNIVGKANVDSYRGTYIATKGFWGHQAR
jgi:hypothetical protein